MHCVACVCDQMVKYEQSANCRTLKPQNSLLLLSWRNSYHHFMLSYLLPTLKPMRSDTFHDLTNYLLNFFNFLQLSNLGFFEAFWLKNKCLLMKIQNQNKLQKIILEIVEGLPNGLKNWTLWDWFEESDKGFIFEGICEMIMFWVRKVFGREYWSEAAFAELPSLCFMAFPQTIITVKTNK